MKIFKATFLCLITLILSQLLSQPAGAFGVGSDGNVYYNRVTTVYPFMNKDTYNNSSFLSLYVKADNNSIYNIAPAFQNYDSEGASSIPSTLAFGTTFKHKNNDNTYNVFYNYTIENALTAALNKGDMNISLTANLTNDKHWNFDRHLETWTAYPTIYVQTYDKVKVKYDTDDYNSDTTVTMGKNIFAPIGALDYPELYFGAYANVCTCGSSKVSNISMILADVKGPKVTAITTTRLNNGYMEEFTNFIAGDKLYINLKFDENIRFAGDQAMALADAPKLKLRVKRIRDNIEEKGISVEANLVSLDKDTLTFEYVVPEKYALPGGEVNTNYFIYGIEPYQNQTSWVSSNNDFVLKLYAKKTSQVNYLSSAHKTKSSIVDLAGNPIEIGGSTVTLKAPAYMDNVAPIVESIRIVRTPSVNNPPINRGDVFAGNEQTVGFYVNFSEKIHYQKKVDHSYSTSVLKADLNIHNYYGFAYPCTARAKTIINNNDGTSTVYFEMDGRIRVYTNPTIYQGMNLPIGINRIYMESGDEWAISDARGNYFVDSVEFINTVESSRIMPDNQLWLDTTLPNTSTSLINNGGHYTPFTYPAGGNTSEFYLPITISDSLGPYGEDYRSATNGVSGSFIWRDKTTGNILDFAYEYAVTGNAEKPTATSYQMSHTGEKNKFEQIDSGNYIHIRLLDNVEYNIGQSQLVIHAVDYAGNVGEKFFWLDLKCDKVGPKITSNGNSNEFIENSAILGVINASIRIYDVSGINSVEIQWTPKDVAPVEENWIVVTNYDAIYTDSQVFTVAKDHLELGSKHRYTLHVKGTDIKGYSNKASFDYEYDLIQPRYNIEFMDNPKDLQETHGVKLFLTDSGDTPPEGVTKSVWALIKKPGTENSYWMRRFGYEDLRGESKAIDILNVNADAAGWSRVNITTGKVQITSEGVTTLESCHFYGDTALTDTEKSELYKLLNQSYGQVEMTIIARRYGEASDDYIIDNEYHAEDTYTLHYTSPSAVDNNDVIHSATLVSKTAVTPSGGTLPTEAGSSLPVHVWMPGSIEDAVFNVTLSNELIMPFGLEDIDFYSSDTRFKLYNIGEEASDIPIFTAPMIPKTSQDIILPNDLTITGTYKVVVSVKSRTTGHIDLCEFSDIEIDRREPDHYGVTQVKSKGIFNRAVGNFTQTDEVATDYAISTDIRPTEIFVSGLPEASQNIRFEADFPSLDYEGWSDYTAFIKVWNQTAGISSDEYQWIRFPELCTYKTVFMDASQLTSIINELNSGSEERAAIIPILPGENVIKYMISLPGTGYESKEQTLLLQAGDTPPTIEMMQTPEKEEFGIINGDVIVSIKDFGSVVVASDTLQIGLTFPDNQGYVSANKYEYQENLKEELRVNSKVTLTENGDYYFYIYDQYHNYGYQKVTVDYIDKEPPNLDVENLSDEYMNTFNFKVMLFDRFSVQDCKLYIGFDDAYSNLLGVAPGTLFEVPTPIGQTWKATGITQSGVYETSTTDLSEYTGMLEVTISGAFRYDKSSTSPTADRTIKITAVDAAGNKFQEWVPNEIQVPVLMDHIPLTITARNEPAQYVSGRLVQGVFEATFSKPVVLSPPNENTQKPVYAPIKPNLPFFANGTYSIKYSDIFGDDYEDTIPIVGLFSPLYNCTVSISETAPTNQNVNVLIHAAFNPEITLELPECIAGGTIELERDGLGAVVGASITMSHNGTISYGLKPNNSAYDTQTRTIVIGNIDKSPPTVELNWVYTADVIDGQTSGEIIVSLWANEDLKSLETGTTHTFTLGDQEPYTFQYEDLSGNGGSIKALPTAVIVAKAAVEADETPPDYDMSVYKNTGGMSTKINSYSKDEYELLYNGLIDKADAFPLFSGVLQLRFQIYDENQTVLSIKADPVTGLPVSGVSVRGTTVMITENANFTLIITDAKNNLTEVPISITKADNTPPVGTVTYVRTSPFTIRGYLGMSDNQPGKVTLKNTSGVMMDTNPGEYQNMFYHEFRDNEDRFTFLFADIAGNNGSVIAAVTLLDMTSPKITNTRWVPFFIDEDKKQYEDVLSDTVTNSDVYVYIQFNRPIQTVIPTILDASGNLEDISLTHTEDSATVVFRQNAKVKITYTALNSRSGSTVMEVGIIDKSPPVILVTNIASSPRSKTYTFTSNEEVFFEFFENGGNVLGAGTKFTKVLELNSAYTFKFTDRAGNSTISKIVVSDIDRVAPGVSIENLPATQESVEAYNLENGTSIPHKVTNQSVTILASMDEVGALIFRGVSHSVTANEKVSLTLDYNGTYEIFAMDLAGMITRYSFRIDCIDKSKPQILLAGGTLMVRQGTSVSDFEAKALDPNNLQVSDNYDTSPIILITGSLTADQLNTPGTYSIEFTATDRANNQRSATYFVRVYDKNALEVLVNGELSQSGETRFVGGKGSLIINVTIDNLPAGIGGIQPYKMYWKSGLNTPGQMKNAFAFSGSFTAPRNGFYTLYIVSQNRETFISYIYVQQ